MDGEMKQQDTKALLQEEKETKRQEENRRLFKIGLMIFITFVACILFFFSILRYEGFAENWSKVMKAFEPIIVGLVLAYLLNPVMKTFEKLVYRIAGPRMEENNARKLSRGIGVACAIIFLLAVITFLIAAIVPATISSVMSLSDKFPGYWKTFNENLDNFLIRNKDINDLVDKGLEQATIYANDLLENTLRPKAEIYISQITSGVVYTVKSLVNFIIGIFVAVYVMTIQETLAGQSKKILYTIFKAKRANTVIEVVHKSSDIFGGFITGKILDSAIIGVICYIGCLILHMPDSVLVAVIIGVTNIIPFFGPFIGAIPTLLLVVIQSPIHALYLLIFVIILQQVDGNIIGPKILGNSTGLSSFWVMFAILVFGSLFGFMGMLLGVPIVGVIYYIIRRIVNQGLRNRGLPTDTKEYMHVTKINPDNKEMIYGEKKVEVENKPKYQVPPGDKLHKELQKILDRKEEKKKKDSEEK